MILKNYTEVNRYFKPHDEVWACAYRTGKDSAKKVIHCLPVKGVLTPFPYDPSKTIMPDETGRDIHYFIPYRKNGTELDYTKAAPIEKRDFATTETECIEAYRQAIEYHVSFYQRIIDSINEDLEKALELTAKENA